MLEKKKKKHNLFYLAEEMLEEQPGEPTSLICKPGKESSDKMETRAGGKQRSLTSLLHRVGPD